MSNFQPYSDGDHYAWQQAQQASPPHTPIPLTPEQQASREAAAAREAEIRSLDGDPNLRSIAGDLVRQLIAAHPDRALDHVVDVEYRRASRMTGRATAFKVWPMGKVRVSWKDSSFDRWATMDAKGRVFNQSPQDPNVELKSNMRWQLIEINPEGHRWLASTVLVLREQLAGNGLPRRSQNPPTARSVPVSASRKNRADRIRRAGARDAVTISNLSAAYENSTQQGPSNRHEKKALRQLARLRAKQARRHARADRVEGKLPKS